MSGGVPASASRPVLSSLPSKSKIRSNCYASSLVNLRRGYSSDLKFKSIKFSERNGSPRRIGICNSSTRPGGSGPGENESRSVLDAFFLGKALAEAVNERIESTVGEVLSAIGRLQSEQQKQVEDFRVDVLERAKRAKEKAAREAMEAQGLVPKSVTLETAPVPNGTSVTISPTTTNDVTTEPDDEDPAISVSDQD